MSILGPTRGYPDYIDEALLKRQSEETREFFPLRPSSAGYCRRKLAHDLMAFYGFEEPLKEFREPPVIRLLSLGSSVEWHSIKNFELIPSVEPELSVRYKQNSIVLFRLDPTEKDPQGRLIEGSLDLAMVHTSGYGGIGDVKSLKDRFSQSFKSKWDESINQFNNMESLEQIPGSPYAWWADDLESFLLELNDPFFEHNFHQVNSYLGTLWAKEHNFDHGFIYRYCKNDSRHLEIRFRPSYKMFAEFKDKCNSINQAVDKKQPELVKKDYAQGSIVCAFCPHKSKCWSQDALKAYFKTFGDRKWPDDVAKMDDAELSAAFETFEVLEDAAKGMPGVEQQILTKLVNAGIGKIKTESGRIYEIKHLKSPRPHFELRRSKL